MNRNLLLGGLGLTVIIAGVVGWRILSSHNAALPAKNAAQTSQSASADKSAPAPSGTAAVGGVQQIKLTTKQIENFIASYRETKAFGDKYQTKFNDADKEIGPGKDMIGEMERVLAAHGVLGDFTTLIGKYGFSSVQEYFQVAYSTFIALVYSRPEMSPEHMKAEMEKSLTQIDSNPNLPAEQKQQIKASIQNSLEVYQKSSPPEGNAEAVRPFADKLKALLEADKSGQE